MLLASSLLHHVQDFVQVQEARPWSRTLSNHIKRIKTTHAQVSDIPGRTEILVGIHASTHNQALALALGDASELARSSPPVPPVVISLQSAGVIYLEHGAILDGSAGQRVFQTKGEPRSTEGKGYDADS